MDTGNVNNSADDYAELDLPPEYCHYQDDGCELATAIGTLLGHLFWEQVIG